MRAPEAENVDFSQNLSLAGKAQRVRYVKFPILGNHNGADYKHRKPGPDWSMVGLSEVKFYRRGRPDRAEGPPAPQCGGDSSCSLSTEWAARG